LSFREGLLEREREREEKRRRVARENETTSRLRVNIVAEIKIDWNAGGI